MIKKILIGTLALAFIGSSTPVFAGGNGNDGCHVPGYEESHKDHGQSNEHKIDIDYLQFEKEMSEKGVIVVRMSNNVDSNGWITYHVLDEEGNQIEVVHVRGIKEDQPATPGGELPDMGVDFEDYPVLEGEDNIQIDPNEEFPPAVGEGEDDIMVDTPATEGGDLPDIGVDFEDYPVLEGEDEMGVTPEPTPELPNVGDGTEEDKIEVEEECGKGEEVPTTKDPVITSPKTGDSSTLIYGVGTLISGAGLFLINRKR